MFLCFASPAGARRLAVWAVMLGCLALLAGCGGASELVYRLQPGDTARFQYVEVVSVSAQKDTAPILPARVELRGTVTTRVTASDGPNWLLEVTMLGAMVEVTDAAGNRQVEQPPDASAILLMRAGTGEVVNATGEIKFSAAGIPLNLLDAFRQTLQRYPELPTQVGMSWPAAVHQELSRPLSENFQGQITYAENAVENGRSAAGDCRCWGPGGGSGPADRQQRGAGRS